jgi:hypothetical protein
MLLCFIIIIHIWGLFYCWNCRCESCCSGAADERSHSTAIAAAAAQGQQDAGMLPAIMDSRMPAGVDCEIVLHNMLFTTFFSKTSVTEECSQHVNHNIL